MFVVLLTILILFFFLIVIILLINWNSWNFGFFFISFLLHFIYQDFVRVIVSQSSFCGIQFDWWKKKERTVKKSTKNSFVWLWFSLALPQWSECHFNIGDPIHPSLPSSLCTLFGHRLMLIWMCYNFNEMKYVAFCLLRHNFVSLLSPVFSVRRESL